MKKLFLLSILIFAIVFQLLIAHPVIAVSVTPTATPLLTPTPEDKQLLDKLKQIEILKEKIATRVAQVRDEQKGALYGKILVIEKNIIRLKNISGEHQFTFSDDMLVYKMKDNSRSEGNQSDLKAELLISTIGNFDQTDKNLLARYIYIQENKIRITGKIIDLDKSNYTLKVKAKDGEKIIDFEKYTQTTLYLKGKGSQKGGFSKFSPGDTVYIMSIPDQKEENRFHALRIINIPMSVIQSTTAVSPPLTPKP